MNALQISICLSFLACLTSAMLLEPCKCSQCSQYSLKVQRCACCVYLLNGKRSADSQAVVHHRNIDLDDDFPPNSLLENDEQVWPGISIEKKRVMDENFEESLRLLMFQRNNLVRHPVMDVVSLTDTSDNVDDAILLQIDSVK